MAADKAVRRWPLVLIAAPVVSNRARALRMTELVSKPEPTLASALPVPAAAAIEVVTLPKALSRQARQVRASGQ
jgi:hypothetical protein